MANQAAFAQIARHAVAIPAPDDGTNADLAAALKMLAMVLMHQMSSGGPTTAMALPPEALVNGGVRNTAGGMISRMSPNEVTGNGHIPKGSSNFGLRALR